MFFFTEYIHTLEPQSYTYTYIFIEQIFTELLLKFQSTFQLYMYTKHGNRWYILSRHGQFNACIYRYTNSPTDCRDALIQYKQVRMTVLDYRTQILFKLPSYPPAKCRATQNYVTFKLILCSAGILRAWYIYVNRCGSMGAMLKWYKTACIIRKLV